MTTVRESILAALTTTLSAAPSIGAPVYRSRVTPVARGESPAIIVQPVQDQANQVAIPKLDWSMLVRVSVIVRGDVPDLVADPLVQSVHARVMSDLTVGGYAYDVQPQSVVWEEIDADSPAAVVSCDFVVLYRTSLTDLTMV
jgi:hypothetical protein